MDRAAQRQAQLTEARARFGEKFVAQVERERRSLRFDRIFSKAAAGFLVLLGLVLVTALAMEWVIYQRLEQGERAEARITKKSERTGSKGQRSPEVHYEFQRDGRTFTGKSRVLLSDYKRLNEGDFIGIYYSPHNPRRSRIILEMHPLRQRADAVLLSFLLAGFGVMGFRRKRKEARSKSAALSFFQALAESHASVTPRALIDTLRAQDAKTAEKLEAVWSLHLDPAETVPAEMRSRTVEGWRESQPQPVDFEEYLARHNYATCRISRDSASPALQVARPGEPVRLRTQGPEATHTLAAHFLYAMAGPPNEGEDKVLRRCHINLSQINRPEILRRQAEAQRIERGVRMNIFLTSARERIAIDEALGKAGVGKECVRPVLVELDPPADEDTQWADYAIVRLVNSFLYTLYLVPWKWQRMERDVLVQVDDFSPVRLHLRFDPAREFTLERVKA